MATQGLVTIRKNGKVIMKIVAGSNGMNAKKLGNAIRRSGKIPSIQSACVLAKRQHFGSPVDLCIITEDAFYNQEDAEVPELYVSTFEKPEFNPRWEHGTADYTEIVDLEKEKDD